MSKPDQSFDAKATLRTKSGTLTYYSLPKLAAAGLGGGDKLPMSIRILLENMLRHVGNGITTAEHVTALANWNAKAVAPIELPFMPARVVLQDFTGVPCCVDLAAMRSAVARLGGDPRKINPLVPVDLVIDHSVQVDQFGSQGALAINEDIEFSRNRERYEFLRWGAKAFANFRVVPPSTGIVHQVNLEYLAKVVFTRPLAVSHEPLAKGQGLMAFPDTLVGTDSHTTMINGLGVLGWGVGGIEAEAVMLGQPIYMLAPEVVGFKLSGKLPEGATATDLVLTVTQMLRKLGVVDKFVEFFGDGLSELGLADRATIANMSPEYGATMGYFPIDEETLRYLRSTGRTDEEVDLVERYAKEQGLFRTDGMKEPVYNDVVCLDLSTVEPSLAGPKRPQDRVRLSDVKTAFRTALTAPPKDRGFGLSEEELTRKAVVQDNGRTAEIGHGSVVISAITSCTNTSNPSVMVGAGLLAKKACERGLSVKAHVKTSLAPGSRVVTEYLQAANLTPHLERLGFHTVGYGCTTCIGNSGPLPEPVAKAVTESNIVAAAVLSGNRNFEGRINALVKANYLASPLLVVAYAIAGRVDIDFETEPLGADPQGKKVYLRDIWPTQKEIRDAVAQYLTPEMFKGQYANVFDGNETWNKIQVPDAEAYQWDPESTYIQEPPFFIDHKPKPEPIQPIREARVLVVVGDSVTTDHISPAGNIAVNGPAGKYLIERGVKPEDFNSYGSRRGNDRVMTRGTFANIRLRNLLVPDTEGGVTRYLGAPHRQDAGATGAPHRQDAGATGAPHRQDAGATGELMSVYDAAMKYKESSTPLIVLAGAEYGAGSSRDWAAKGTLLLGVRAVIAVSYERIHRSNLVGMGVLPLQFKPTESRETLGLTGEEIYSIEGLSDAICPKCEVTVTARPADGKGPAKKFGAIVRIDTPIEVDYYRNGGILQTVLRKLMIQTK